MLICEKIQKENLKGRDKFGNNILHYLFSVKGKNLELLSNIPEEDIKLMRQEPNIYDITPNEIAIVNGYNIQGTFTKKFSYEGLVKTIGNSWNLFPIDGLIVNDRILYACMNNLKNTSSSEFSEYLDINFRDVNGKHLVHYSPYCFTETFTKNLNLSLKDILFCKDGNQTMPFQTSRSFTIDILAKIEELPKFNYISHTDDLGMFRYLYRFAFDSFHSLILMKETNFIGFDYSSGQPELVSLCTHRSDGIYYFSIEKSPLKQLRNVHFFGTVDGDDISHYVVRYYLHFIRNHPHHYVMKGKPILQALIARGLRMDFVKNSKGQTAFDLINELACNTPVMLANSKYLKKDVKRGLGNNSKALAKFIIEHKGPKELIVEESETTLALKCEKVAHFSIKMKRKLYFEYKPKPTEKI
ncbi:predicted protein [Naegleria gruberi]|uniref:Predicted protein n=1 Tax=Naegleria gruberi TaxID=5762 RepID=D2VCH3_NAEGR|nr:uncharacterized protein NAEGRDRAFT_66571 [Naegleria gruberi]EFC45310.1 predicted protein [Naegleria gruberi]|eukprot:XP_002678054.1 predicted protein [Naegleria gruberi strain NEG-M]